MKICHIIIRSLTAAFNELSLLVKDNFDIIAITETLINDSVPDNVNLCQIINSPAKIG